MCTCWKLEQVARERAERIDEILYLKSRDRREHTLVVARARTQDE